MKIAHIVIQSNAFTVWIRKNCMISIFFEGKNPVLYKKLLFEKHSMMGMAKIHKHMKSIWKSNEVKNCDAEKSTLESFIIDSIYSLVLEYFYLMACFKASASRLCGLSFSSF